MAITGQKTESLAPMVIVTAERNGSVLETLIFTDMCRLLLEMPLGWKDISDFVKCTEESNCRGQVISPIRRKPKKANEIAAQSIRSSSRGTVRECSKR